MAKDLLAKRSVYRSTLNWYLLRGLLVVVPEPLCDMSFSTPMGLLRYVRTWVTQRKMCMLDSIQTFDLGRKAVKEV